MIAYKVAKEALSKIIGLRGTVEKQRQKAADALAESEIQFGKEAEQSRLLVLAEIKLRAARELAEQASEHLISAVAKISGAVPKEGAQTELFETDTGSWRLVITAPEIEQEAPAPAPETPLEKEIARKAAEAEAGEKLNGTSREEFEEDRVNAENLFPKLSKTQKEIIDRLALTEGPVFPDAFPKKAEKNALVGLQTRKAVQLAGGGNLTLSPVGWALRRMITETTEDEA